MHNLGALWHPSTVELQGYAARLLAESGLISLLFTDSMALEIVRALLFCSKAWPVRADSHTAAIVADGGHCFDFLRRVLLLIVLGKFWLPLSIAVRSRCRGCRSDTQGQRHCL